MAHGNRTRRAALNPSRHLRPLPRPDDRLGSLGRDAAVLARPGQRNLTAHQSRALDQRIRAAQHMSRQRASSNTTCYSTPSTSSASTTSSSPPTTRFSTPPTAAPADSWKLPQSTTQLNTPSPSTTPNACFACNNQAHPWVQPRPRAVDTTSHRDYRSAGLGESFYIS
jgi:hypothetical protein